MGPVTIAGLASLLAGGALVMQHSVGFVWMLVRIGRLFTKILRLVEFHTQVVVLVELDRHTVNMTGGFRRARRRTV